MDREEKWGVYLLAALLLSLASATAASDPGRRRSVIEVEGEPSSVVWVVQLSDLHFSIFHPERARDFKRYVPAALAMINPCLVLITGDLTDGKSKDLLTMKQEESEWIEYQNVIEDVVERSGLNEKIFYDVRGNHDSFGVPEVGGAYDFYQKYGINAGLRREGNVHSITLQNSGWKHLFVGFDSTMEIGLRGPTNLFGHPTDRLLADIDMELSQWDDDITNSAVTKIAFGHFPLSFSALTDTGRSLKDVFLNHSLSAYLCGHLHTRFGKNLKRHHQSGHHFLSSGTYYQFNIHQGTLDNVNSEKCSNESKSTNEFWEWEMGDWRKSRAMRIVAIDSGHVSYVDVDFRLGSKDTIILPTFPVDSRFMQRISSSHDYICQTKRTLSYATVRALVFSRTEIVTVLAKVYDTRSGSLSLVLDSTMRKLEGNGTRGDMYTVPWNWRAFADPSPDRYWLQIEALDIYGKSSYSQLMPFSINGLNKKVSWKWKEFFVMGCQWASIYHPVLWSVLSLLFSLLLIPQVFLACSKKYYTYKYLSPGFSGRSLRGCLTRACWVLIELPKMTLIWSGILLYVLYLLLFPWFFGYVFTESHSMAYMTYRGWAVPQLNNSSGLPYIGVPDVMVVVLPHLCFVVLPTILVIAAMAAEKTAYRTHYLSLSGKKEDDLYKESKKHMRHASFCSGCWMRKLLLLVCLVILWKHWKHCRALVKAYDMNPFLHSPLYCFTIPVLLIYAIYRTSSRWNL
ncbi:putative metallophosphoesterase At3g03305 [Elaeis guineensis]|uniref:putative metallophosphoesterase At3g03305 n=1 Tax=Elaeis guineensis var. tenera TaxID=51953 RepID=UPI003C6D82A1